MPVDSLTALTEDTVREGILHALKLQCSLLRMPKSVFQKCNTHLKSKRNLKRGEKNQDYKQSSHFICHRTIALVQLNGKEPTP